MPVSTLAHHAHQALLLALVVSMPVVLVAGVVGLLVAAVQAASQIQDATIAHLPRLLVVSAALVVMGPWMGRQVAVFAEQLFALVAR